MTEPNIEQVGGIGQSSILRTYSTVRDLDPWVLAAITTLTYAAIEYGYWDRSNLDRTFSPPMPHRAHPIWEIVVRRLGRLLFDPANGDSQLDKRYELTAEQAIWTRPIWVVADNGLPCVHWVNNMPLAFCLNRMVAPSSSVPSEVDTNDFEEDERRGRGQTPRSQPATGVTLSQEKGNEQVEPDEGDGFEDNNDDEEIPLPDFDFTVKDLEGLKICEWPN
ncbi:hypothetical protein IWX49DRAFT_551742 [Phyllosticta citricarpa]|uniref:Uncharacterized protein n=2 Tax=Phyllosticta TaxID=121621 RepID=A0ABR1M9W3_9PEZI